MDLTIDQSSLSRALRLVGRALPTRTSLPILQSVLIEADLGQLRLSTSDGELALTTTIAVDVIQPGRIAIPARLLGEYVSQLPEETVRLTLDGPRKRVRAICGRFRADFASLDPEGFPQSVPPDTNRTFDLAPLALRRAIDRVAFAACHDDGRPTLTAVLFDFGESGLTLAAADGFRLARVRIPDVVADSRQLLVPARAVAEFGRLLVEGEKVSLGLTSDDRGIHLRTGATTLYSRLIEGRFPDVERVIPKSWETKVTVEAVGFRQALRLTSVFGGSGKNECRSVVLEAEPGVLRLRARGDQTGEAESEIEATLEGPPQAIALSTGLLGDILDAVEGKEVELSWTRPILPLVVREVKSADSADLWLTMPVLNPSLTKSPAQAA